MGWQNVRVAAVQAHIGADRVPSQGTRSGLQSLVNGHIDLNVNNSRPYE